MRIALTAEGTRGDLYPLLALGDACRDAGHEVRVCAPPNFREEVEARGMEFRSSGTDVVQLLQEHSGALVHGGLRMARAQQACIEELLSNTFETLPEATRGMDLILGAGVQVGAPTAAELNGAVYRYVVYCPALLPSREYGPALTPLQQLPPWANAALWRFLVPLLSLPIRLGVNRWRRALGLAPTRDILRHLLGERPLLAADGELAPLPGGCRWQAEPIGALQDAAEEALPEKLETFLQAGPPPVFLGFGSMTDPEPERTTRTLLAAVERVGCRALISHGWAGLGREALPEQVFPLGPVPHARLFPRVAAVVHHGGAGTTTTCARAGVPQIVVPHVLDQFYWCRRVRELGLGPPHLPRRKLGVEALASLLEATLHNELLSERCQELGARLRHRDPLLAANRGVLLERVLAP